LINAITNDHVTAWLKSIHFKSNKSWNNCRNDLSAIFEWGCTAPRCWIEKNPVALVERFSKKSLRPQARRRLEIDQCVEIMAYLEKNNPEWCCFFAIALFSGIRPDMRSGEIWELGRCVERDGLNSYYSNGCFHLTAEITKEGAPRTTTVPQNLAAWLKRYPPTRHRICPNDHKAYVGIRKRFKIPHDGLRHTAISAFVAARDSFALAAQEFGNSEPIIRKHYLCRMSAEEAAGLYGILPRKGAKAQFSGRQSEESNPPPNSDLRN
jgi:hypothetical protein